MEWLRKFGWLNILLVFVPIALAMRWTGTPAAWIFIASAIAIIPLAGLMGKSTEMLAERLGPAFYNLPEAEHAVMEAAEMGRALWPSSELATP